MISASDFPQSVLERAPALRSSVAVPPELDSEFFAARFAWLEKKDEEAAERIREYLSHRRLVGYDKMDEMTILTSNPMTKAVFERFSCSSMTTSPKSGSLHVFVQRMKGVHLKEILKVVPASYIFHSYFALQDVFGRVIAKTERETGKRSGVVTILDLSGLNLSEFLNPLSVQCKLARLIVFFWAEYFGEALLKLLIVNPPGIVSLMWQITKQIIDERTVNRLSFLSSPQELFNHLDIEAIPAEYGGKRVDDSGYSSPPSACANAPLPVTSADYSAPDFLWRKFDAPSPKPKSHSLKGHKSLELPVNVAETKQTLLWWFTTSGDVTFEIARTGAEGALCWPKLRLASLIVPEQGSVELSRGDYVVRFTNPDSTWLPTKVNVALHLLD